MTMYFINSNFFHLILARNNPKTENSFTEIIDIIDTYTSHATGYRLNKFSSQVILLFLAMNVTEKKDKYPLCDTPTSNKTRIHINSFHSCIMGQGGANYCNRPTHNQASPAFGL